MPTSTARIRHPLGLEMNPKNDPNNIRLRDLIETAGLTQKEALDLFNRKMVKAYSMSVWKAYLADRTSVRWRRLDDDLLRHAEKVFSNPKKLD